MARMIPDYDLVFTNSRAERELFDSLRALDDNFIVVHSFPWLNSAVTTLDTRKAIMGETDFIIIHPDLGLLAIEVKGGKFKTIRGRFIYTRTGSVFDPFRQLQRGIFTLDSYIKKAGLNIRVGQAYIFPDVIVTAENAPAIIKDTSGFRIYIDASDIRQAAKRIVEIMKFWRTGLPPVRLTQDNINTLIDLIAPSSENLLTWEVISENDRYRWLLLTSEQEIILNRALDADRVVVRGRPGTGKTLIAVEIAKRKSAEGKKVLFISYNRPLVDEKLKIELKNTSTDVMTFHSLCYRATRKLGQRGPNDEREKEWFEKIGPQQLRQAISMSRLGHYDILIIDEGQVLRLDWLKLLRDWIPVMYVFCDPSQSFNYEPKTMPNEIEKLIDVEFSGWLTAAVRTLREVHNRLEVALPERVQQVSLRDHEDGRVEERVTALPIVDELTIVINELYQDGAKSEHIAVVHDSSGKLDLPTELEKKIHNYYSSGRIRGLEYPIIICLDIRPDDEAQLISAYTRATSKVIALYSVGLLNTITNLEQFPFFRQILEKPEVIAALNDNEALIMRSLGWQWSDEVEFFPYPLKWVESIGMWLISDLSYTWEDINSRLNHHKYNLLTNYVSTLTEKPVARITITLGPALLIQTSHWERFDVHLCSRCHHMALVKTSYDKTLEEHNLIEEICVYCGDVSIQPMPDLSKLTKELRILKNSKASREEKLTLSPHLMALGILEALISKYPKYKERICNLLEGDITTILPRLIIAQIILRKGSGTPITMSEWINRVRDWTGNEKMVTYVSRSTPLWTKRGWVKKLKQDQYVITLEDELQH